ncbi:MAG: 23S rRNA (pseudouridine(1915)-N(3))-methyltransferase RlmH [Acidobacteriota bacterium]
MVGAESQPFGMLWARRPMGEGAPDLVLCWPGRTVAEYARAGVSDYLGRIRRHRSCRCLVVPEEAAGNRYSKSHRMARDGRSILKRLEPLKPLYMVVVDPRGRMLGSKEFARFVHRQCYDDSRTLAFVVGGPDGVAGVVRDCADMVLALSPMTLPHDMARLILVEQVYRGLTLIHGLPYSR